MPLKVGSHAIKKDLNYVCPEWFNSWNPMDTTTAIQEAITYASTNDKNVKLEKKTYFVTNTIRLYKNVNLIGEYGTIVRRIGSQVRMFVNGVVGSTSYAVAYEGDGNIHIERIQFDLNASNVAQNNGISAFDLAHGENIVFKECSFENGKNGHFVQVAGCKKVYFDKCSFKNQTLDVSDTKRDFEAVQVEFITAASFPAFGSYDNTPSIDIRLIDCHFENVIRGFGTHTTIPDQFNEDISIINCTFKNMVDNAIHSVAYRDIKLIDNRIDTCEHGIYILNCQRALTRNNEMKNTKQSAMHGSNSTIISESDVGINNSQATLNTPPTTYSAFRFAGSNVSIKDTHVTYTSGNPLYSFGIYASNSDVSINNDKNITKGIDGKVSCTNGEEARVFGSRIVTLWEGELNTAGTIITLPEKLTNYSMIVICGNDNTNVTATMTSAVIPLPLLNFGSSTNRFRLITDSNSSTGQSLNDRLGFSFPTNTQIRLDEKQGDGAIRKIYAYI